MRLRYKIMLIAVLGWGFVLTMGFVAIHNLNNMAGR